jgi:DNA polymerase III epsilon subunit family exonuclease
MTRPHSDPTPGGVDAPRKPLRESTFAVVDLETTGVDPSTDRIIQMAAVVVDSAGQVVEVFDTVVRPECPDEYVHAAEHIHGITAEQVAGGMPLREALERLRHISSDKIFTAHNARFDIGFLQAESERVGMDLSVPTYVDTLQIARRTDAERTRRHSLDALCQHYGIQRERAHEALSDATATAELLFRLIADLGMSGTDHVDDLFS